MVYPDVSDNQKTCPACHRPLAPGVKFCESCGMKVDPAPVCPHCSVLLTPGVKFCETCGKPVGAPPTLPAPAAPPLSVPEAVTSAPVAESAAAAPDIVTVEMSTSPSGPVPAEHVTAEPLPEKIVGNVSAPLPPVPPLPEEKSPDSLPEPIGISPDIASDKKIPAGPKETARKTTLPAPASRATTLVIAGIVGLLVIAALAWFIIVPILSGPGNGGSGLSLPGSSPPPSAVPTGSAVQSRSAASFEVQPTQRMPVNLEVTYQAERNNINGLVTVTFAGGPGMNGISQTAVTLTKSDGTVETKNFKPKQTGDSVTLQGTLKTDRLEVIANFYNGDSYRVIDQLFEYKKKN